MIFYPVKQAAPWCSKISFVEDLQSEVRQSSIRNALMNPVLSSRPDEICYKVTSNSMILWFSEVAVICEWRLAQIHTINQKHSQYPLIAAAKLPSGARVFLASSGLLLRIFKAFSREISWEHMTSCRQIYLSAVLWNINWVKWRGIFRE